MQVVRGLMVTVALNRNVDARITDNNRLALEKPKCEKPRRDQPNNDATTNEQTPTRHSNSSRFV
jgi:hypothetical protein